MNTYLCIDLKSFYASVECVKRGLDPLTTNLVVADSSRSEKTICLAVSPSLKELGVSSRPRLFEVNQQIKKINLQRKRKIKNLNFSGESVSKIELKNNDALAIGFIIAPPNMSEYIKISAKIYEIYSHFISKDDIHVYSIDEVFIDITKYLKLYNLTAYELATKLIKEVLNKTGIIATAGIGTNLYLAKVAMDILAKHISPNKDGIRIATLDEIEYRKILWTHKPLTDFWRVGQGYANKLAKYNIFTMGDIARCSLGKTSAYYNEDLLYELFGVNAELLIDHAWGYEPCTIKDIKNYKSENKSMGIGQVLKRPYSYIEGMTIAKEMVEQLVFDLIEKHYVTKTIVLSIGYDSISLKDEKVEKQYQKQIKKDYYGRDIIKHAHGTINLERLSSSLKYILKYVINLYESIVDKNLFIRRVNITCIVIDETEKENDLQLSLFDDFNKLKQELNIEQKERRIQNTLLEIKKRFGKNAVIKAIDLKEEATTKERNNQIGGHKA